jgi:hypothetical protein
VTQSAARRSSGRLRVYADENGNDLQRALHAGFRLPGYSEDDVLTALGLRDA